MSRALKEVPDVLTPRETILARGNMLLSIPGDTVTLSRIDLMLPDSVISYFSLTP